MSLCANRELDDSKGRFRWDGQDAYDVEVDDSLN